jgi:hypothetical protein
LFAFGAVHSFFVEMVEKEEKLLKLKEWMKEVNLSELFG